MFLRVVGKGRKERLVPLRPELARRLERFGRFLPTGAPADRFFVAVRRSADGTYRPTTRSGVLQMLGELKYRAGLTKRLYPHLFRHSFATEALRRGMSPVQLASILGHSGLQMIERNYSHLNTTDAYEAVLRMLANEA